VLDRYLARFAYRGQITTDVPPGHPALHTRDNVDETIPGDRGAHGIFDARARTRTTPWKPVLVGIGLLLGATLLLPSRSRS
jgi:hypothetical protein